MSDRIRTGRIVSVTPIAPGWKAIYVLHPGIEHGALHDLPDEQLFYVSEIAALIHVEEWDRVDGRRARDGDEPPDGPWDYQVSDSIRPVTLDYYYAPWTLYEENDPLLVLQPGQERDVRADAIKAIEAHRDDEMRRYGRRDARDGHDPACPDDETYMNEFRRVQAARRVSASAASGGQP